MADAPQIPDEAETRARWGAFAWTAENAEKAKTVIARDPAGRPLKPGFRTGFAYYDCQVDDARLVVLNARDAADRGADIRTGTKVVTARRENGHWNVEMENVETGARETVRARMLVYAAGPWID